MAKTNWLQYEKAGNIKSSEITPEHIYKSRRKFMAYGASSGLLAAMPSIGSTAPMNLPQDGSPNASNNSAIANAPAWLKRQVADATPSETGNTSELGETLTPHELTGSYNNFYEFGFKKSDPAKHGAKYTPPQHWSIRVSGACEKPGDYYLEDLIKDIDLQERIYRLRCVEAWSMVIPWIGVPLSSILDKFVPSSSARFVEFVTVVDEEQMPGQRSLFSNISWPYIEALRLDEAMNPLTILAVGLFGQVLPGQNGAPARLVIPWKYGFKSIKSIVGIKFTATPPLTTWNVLQPAEYGFYANVVPFVRHPRWTQQRERRLPSTFFSPNWIDTLMFNGYAEEVAHLYSGFDFHTNY